MLSVKQECCENQLYSHWFWPDPESNQSLLKLLHRQMLLPPLDHLSYCPCCLLTASLTTSLYYRDARKVHLISPTSISVSPLDGSVYVAETDQSFIHRIRRIDPYTNRIATVAGMDSKCDCAMQECQCFGGDGGFARSASLHNPISITATTDGSVYVADQLNLRIRKVGGVRKVRYTECMGIQRIGNTKDGVKRWIIIIEE